MRTLYFTLFFILLLGRATSFGKQESEAVVMRNWAALTLVNLESGKARALTSEESKYPQAKQAKQDVEAVLSGQPVRILGRPYVNTTSKKVNEFLLLAYTPSCAHVPPPGPQQIIHVKLKKGAFISIESLYQKVWVEGQLEVKKGHSSNMESGFTMSDISPKSITQFRWENG